MSDLVAALHVDLAGFLLLLGLQVVAGGVKGVLGIGLPLVAVPVLSQFMPVPTAIAAMTLPILVSNLYQGLDRRFIGPTLRRFWPMILTTMVVCGASAQLLVALDARTTYLSLGVIVVAFALFNLVAHRVVLPPRLEKPLGPVVGVLAGALGGLSNFFGPPIIVYLVSLQLPKDAFVAAVGLAFVAAGLPLWGTLAAEGVLGPQELLLSAVFVLPVMLGVLFGQRLRQRVPQQSFRRILLGVLVLIGLSLVRRGLGW